VSNRLRIAVAGLGRIGWPFHFRQAHESPHFDIVAVIDPLKERLDEAKAMAGCKTYKTFPSLFRGEPPDVVVVATPTDMHERMTRRALREGCHVILEKPMTTSLRSADRMIAEAEKNNRRIFLYQPHRLTAETQTIKGILDSGKLGPVHLIHANRSRYVRRHDWQSLRKNGGGMLNNYGAHGVDQMLYLSDGSGIQDVQCSMWAVATRGDADDVVKIWMKGGSGQLLDLEINQAASYAVSPWHICGKYGTAIREENVFKIRYYDPTKAPALEVVEGAAPGRRYDSGEELPWQEEEILIDPSRRLDFYENIHDVLTNGAEPHIKIEESRELMRILELCRKRSGF